jgi:phosphatidylglycerol:prolipoprotein diacylglycerol transferase
MAPAGAKRERAAPGRNRAFVTLADAVPTAVIVLDFDPILRLGDVTVRLETVALASAILVAMLLGAGIVARIPAGDSGDDHPRILRRDDLLFVVLGIVPGALLGGRLGFVLLHLDFYRSDAAAIFDPGRGGLELSLAVVGGALTGVSVASLLDGSVGRWLHAGALPVLLGLGLGKLAMALGGNGQGRPTDVGWATAYLGDGPWASLAPWVPSHPAQVYEALVAFVVLFTLAVLLAVGLFRRPDGRLFLVGVGAWATGRSVVGTTWRDPEVLGPLSAGQLIAVAVAIGSFAVAALVWRASGRTATPVAGQRPAWPDPETRPPF